MNSKFESPDSQFVRQIKQLVELICPHEPHKESIAEHANHYFTITAEQEGYVEELTRELAKREDDNKKEPQTSPLLRGLRKRYAE